MATMRCRRVRACALKAQHVWHDAYSYVCVCVFTRVVVKAAKLRGEGREGTERGNRLGRFCSINFCANLDALLWARSPPPLPSYRESCPSNQPEPLAVCKRICSACIITSVQSRYRNRAGREGEGDNQQSKFGVSLTSLKCRAVTPAPSLPPCATQSFFVTEYLTALPLPCHTPPPVHCFTSC